MNLELLPNEIFLDLFGYFDDTDLLYAFYGLNFRFNYLLYKQYRAYRFNFHSISKRKFDMICQQHLPFLADRVLTLSLSNVDDTPEQIDLFFSYIPSINLFTHLRALSISNIRTCGAIMKILDQCHHLHHFTHIKIDYSYFQGDQLLHQFIIDKIWRLPELIQCDLNCTMGFGLKACVPTNISASLERLSLPKYTMTLNQINHLFQYTPHLKHLSITVVDFDNDYLPSILPTLISLNLCVARNPDAWKITSLLQNMPHLRLLNIDLPNNIIDGYQWEQMICNYLPELQIFRCKMIEGGHSNGNIETRMTKLMNSFQGSFWIDEHKWFVRCFAWERTIYLGTRLNTLPYNEETLPNLFLSTYPDDHRERFCNEMTEIFSEAFFNHRIPSNIRLTNIKHLSIKFPIHEQFWSIVPNLNRLHTLTIYLNVHTSPSELQTLLDLAPYLNKLNICQEGSLPWPFLLPLEPSQTALLIGIKKSVRELDMQHLALYSTEEECLVLSHSSLGGQCEVLSIAVNSCECILILLHNMKNLRALSVYCRGVMSFSKEINNKYPKKMLNDDEIIQWLKERLPSTCLTSKGTGFRKNQIGIWIG